jgi:hypothetical protein
MEKWHVFFVIVYNQLTPWSRVLENLTVFSAAQEIPFILWNLWVNYWYFVYKSLP